MVYVVAQKSPRKKKLDEVSAIGIKSETDSGSREVSSGAHWKIYSEALPGYSGK